MAEHEAACGPGEAAVGDQRHRLAETSAHDGTRDVEHLAHAGPAHRTLVADNDDIAIDDGAILNRRQDIFLALEDLRRPHVVCPLVAGEFCHAALRRQVAAQDEESTAQLDRLVDGAHHLLARCLHDIVSLLANRPAGDCHAVLVQATPRLQATGDKGDAASTMQVGGDEKTAGLHADHQRRAP